MAPDDSSPTVIATNFGLLVTWNRGETFQMICPEAIERFSVDNGLQPLIATPTVAVLPGGQGILATRWPLGALRSTDGCGWSIIEDDLLMLRTISSMTLSTSGTVFVSFSSGTDPLGIAETTDGLTFSFTSAQSDVLIYNGVMAANDALTLYATTTEYTPTAIQTLLVSLDAGASWNPASTFEVVSISLGAVDPLDPTRLVLRERTNVGCAVTDTLLLSEDGGALTRALRTWEEDPLTGADIRPNGDIWVASFQSGVAITTDEGDTWQPSGPNRARCLSADENRVVACTTRPDDDLGLVAITTDEGETWEPWVTWDKVTGPPECLSRTCEAHWERIDRSWINPVAPPDGGASRFDVGGSMRMEEDEGSEGCGCRLGGRAVPPTAVLLCLALLPLLRSSVARGRPTTPERACTSDERATPPR